MSALRVALEVHERGDDHEPRFEATVTGYPVLRGLGRSLWEAVHRLVESHRDLLERRWAREVWR